ncbi:MAG TPA: hypothetical protein VFF06_09230 [Polyangia bacterium]|nr:hypothetical protein [Polyangia bacterium]
MRMWLAALALAACNTPGKAPSALVSHLEAGDTVHAAQFAYGFYSIEDKSWRWTGKQFIAVLAPPEGAASRTTSLSLALTAAESVFKRNPSVTVTCAVDGQRLKPETYTAPGRYVLVRPIEHPLTAPSAQVMCVVDHTFTPGIDDTRELGIIVNSIGLI